MSRATTLWLALLAVALRLPGLRTDFWLDEIWALDNVGAVGSALGVFTSIHHDSNHWLVSLWMHSVGPTAAFWVYRLPSFAFGVVTVLLAGRLARATDADPTVATLLVAVSFPLGFYASEARGYAIAACAGFGALLCLMRWVERGEVRWLAAHWIVASLGLLAHLSFVVVLGAEMLFLRMAQSREARGGRVLLPFAAPLVLLFALGFVDLRYLQFGGGPQFVEWRLLQEVGALAIGAPVDAPGVSWWAAAGLSAIVVALVAVARRPPVDTRGADRPADVRRIWMFYAAILILPVVGVLALRPPFFFARYFLVSLAFVPLLLADAFGRLARRTRVAVLIVLVLLNAWSWIGFAETGRGHYERAVADMARAAGASFTVSGDHEFRVSTVLAFYGRRMGLWPDRFAYADSGGQFFIASEPGPPEAQPGCPDCVLFGVYRSSPLSGSTWRVYRASGEAAEPPSGVK